MNIIDLAKPTTNKGAAVDVDPLSHGGKGVEGPQELSELFDFGNTPSGLDLSEFMVPGDLDFLNAFDLGRVAF